MISVKPILFNTEMVWAIIDGRKTMTRRVVKLPIDDAGITTCKNSYAKEISWVYTDVDGAPVCDIVPPYQSGDILYVLECFNVLYPEKGSGDLNYDCPEWFYRASAEGELWEKSPGWNWKSSIYMPKKATRIWLKVTDVRVERLRDITWEDGYREGLENPAKFNELWNSTIKRKDLPIYGWEANPRVWVIEFERCEKPNSI